MPNVRVASAGWIAAQIVRNSEESEPISILNSRGRSDSHSINSNLAADSCNTCLQIWDSRLDYRLEENSGLSAVRQKLLTI